MTAISERKKNKIVYIPGTCPHCGSTEISYGKEHYDGWYLIFPMSCKRCGKKSSERYYTEYSETVG